MPRMTACARTPPWPAWPSSKPFFDKQVRQHHRRQQFADHRRRRMAAAGFGRGGQEMEPQAARQDRRQRSGPGSTRRRWASARCMPRRRSCSVMASASTISMPGKSTKPSPPRSSAASKPGKIRRLLPEQLGLPGALGALDEDKTEYRWRRHRARPPGRRFRRAHRAASAACAARENRPNAAWPPSASAAAMAAQCWSKPEHNQ